MADPFEVRMRFTNLLSHLSASTTSSLKTAHYALKHRDMDEDLHSCIIENLERGISASNSTSHTQTSGQQQSNGNSNQGAGNTTAVPVINNSAASMNNRANIMYFLEHFCEMAIREGHQPYVEFVRRDIDKIVNCVAASGANVKVVRNVVGQLGSKGVLDEKVVNKIEEDLKLKEQERGQLLGEEEGEGEEGEEEHGDNINGQDMIDDKDTNMINTSNSKQTQRGDSEIGRKTITTATSNTTAATATAATTSTSEHTTNNTITTNTNKPTPRPPTKDLNKPTGVSKADKRAIEQRIEEDRERNKRLREGVWAVVPIVNNNNNSSDNSSSNNNHSNDEFELEKMWDEGSDLSEDDYVIAGEEADERRQFARYHRSLLER